MITNKFPNQKVSRTEKNKESWYMDTADYLIAKATAVNDRSTTRKLYEAAKGNIDSQDYKAVLNPYNSSNEAYTKYPAKLRHIDKMSGIIRRYIGEYERQVHDIAIVSCNPEVVMQRDMQLEQEVTEMAIQAFINELNSMGMDTGAETKELPDLESFIQEFKENYISDESEQAQDILEALEFKTDANYLYLKAYYDYIVTGETYSYRDIRNGEFYKEIVPVEEAFPIPNGEFFAEDYNAFVRKKIVNVSQVLDDDREWLDDKDIDKIKDLMNNRIPNSRGIVVPYDLFVSLQGESRAIDICKRDGLTSRDLTKQGVTISNLDGDSIARWHIVWTTEVKKGNLHFINQYGLEEVIPVNEDFELNESIGHMSIDWYWDTEVYEMYRYGNDITGLYTKPKPIIYQRKGKLPYNGIREFIPNGGRFSIPEILLPYNVSRNIMSFYRELTISKLKAILLTLPQSILGKSSTEVEKNLHRITSSGFLIFDDSDPNVLSKVERGIRKLDLSIGNFISEIDAIIKGIDEEAKEAVDMTAQRYGEIANSAGKGTTQEAIIRGTTGTIIIVKMFDKFRERDYAADIDYTKLAWIEGRTESFMTKDGKTRYMSLDTDSHIMADYLLFARSSDKLTEDLNTLKEWGFSAVQNGEFTKAIEIIKSNNIDKISKAWARWDAVQRQHENTLKELDAELEESKARNEENKIALEHQNKLEQIDRTKQYDLEIAKIKANAGYDVWDNPPPQSPTGGSILGEYNKDLREEARLEAEADKEERRRFEKDREFNLKKNKQDN